MTPSSSTPGKETDERGSRFAQDMPGAALGDRKKFKDMIEAGQDHKGPPPPKAYPGKEAAKTRGDEADNDYSGMADQDDAAPPNPHRQEPDNKPS